jgi:hypothetical protein
VERKPDIGADAFCALDLRVGRVLEVEPFPEARRPAWKITVDFGPEVGTLRTSAQVTNYTAEESSGSRSGGDPSRQPVEPPPPSPGNPWSQLPLGVA